jgi:hypothetical protein
MIRSFILAAPPPWSGLFHKVNHGFEYAGPFGKFHLVGAHKAGLHQVVGQVFVIARRQVGDKLEERVLNVLHNLPSVVRRRLPCRQGEYMRHQYASTNVRKIRIRTG